MINECANKNIPSPSFKYDFSGFIVEFRGNSADNIDGTDDGAIDGAAQTTKGKLAILLKVIVLNEGQRTPEYRKATNLGSERTISVPSLSLIEDSDD